MLLDVPSSNDWSPDDGWFETISKLSVAQRFDYQKLWESNRACKWNKFIFKFSNNLFPSRNKTMFLTKTFKIFCQDICQRSTWCQIFKSWKHLHKICWSRFLVEIFQMYSLRCLDFNKYLLPECGLVFLLFA